MIKREPCIFVLAILSMALVDPAIVSAGPSSLRASIPRQESATPEYNALEVFDALTEEDIMDESARQLKRKNKIGKESTEAGGESTEKKRNRRKKMKMIENGKKKEKRKKEKKEKKEKKMIEDSTAEETADLISGDAKDVPLNETTTDGMQNATNTSISEGVEVETMEIAFVDDPVLDSPIEIDVEEDPIVEDPTVDPPIVEDPMVDTPVLDNSTVQVTEGAETMNMTFVDIAGGILSTFGDAMGGSFSDAIEEMVLSLGVSIGDALDGTLGEALINATKAFGDALDNPIGDAIGDIAENVPDALSNARDNFVDDLSDGSLDFGSTLAGFIADLFREKNPPATTMSDSQTIIVTQSTEPPVVPQSVTVTQSTEAPAQPQEVLASQSTEAPIAPAEPQTVIVTQSATQSTEAPRTTIVQTKPAQPTSTAAPVQLEPPAGSMYPAECQTNPQTAVGEFKQCLTCPEGHYSRDQTLLTFGVSTFTCEVINIAGLCGLIPGSACLVLKTVSSGCECITP